MNYLAEIIAFEQWLETHYLPISAQLLWYKFMSICNRAGWSEWVTVDNLRLMAAMQMSREATLIKARDELIKAGLIIYQRGKKGSPNKYKLISFTFKRVVQSEVQGVVEPVVQSEVQGVVESEDIYKHKQNINENIPPISPDAISEFISEYPKPCNRAVLEMPYCKVIMGGINDSDLLTAVKNYAEACGILNTQERFIKNADNFLKDNTYVKYLPGQYVKPSSKTQGKNTFNTFNGFEQNDYNFDDLEKRLIGD